MKYYVYHAYGLNNELLYIGKGTGGRLRHCNSGTSSNLELNKYYFENGCNAISVDIIKRFETDEEALNYERFCILTLKPRFNKDMNIGVEGKTYNAKTNNMQDRLKAGYVVDFAKLMKLYLVAVQKQDVEFVSLVDKYSPDHKQCLDVLGLVKIKRIGYNKTKLMTALDTKLNINKNNYILREELCSIFEVSQRYSLKNVRDVFVNLYEKYNIDAPPKSTDIKNFFSVKDVFMTVDGKRSKGYLILDDLYKENV